MENVRNHVDVKLLTKWDGRYGAEAMIAKSNFHSRSVFALKIGRRRTAQIRGKVQQADLRGYVYTRHIESLLVRISPRVYITTISRQI